MTWQTAIAELRREVTAKIVNAVISVFLFPLTAQTSSLGDKDNVDRSDDGVDPGTTKKTQRPVARYEPFGHRARPPKGLRAICLKLGTSNVVFLGIAPTASYGPQDLDVGETAIYNVGKAIVRLWKSGKLTVDSDTGGGQDVVVNGGTAKVARVGDEVDCGTLYFVPGTSGASLSWVAPGGPAPPSGTAVAMQYGTIHSGADHFKG